MPAERFALDLKLAWQQEGDTLKPAILMAHHGKFHSQNAEGAEALRAIESALIREAGVADLRGLLVFGRSGASDAFKCGHVAL